MGKSGAERPTPAGRKEAERQRLAAALRANLSRRKTQSRDRRAGEAAPDAGADPRPAPRQPNGGLMDRIRIVGGQPLNGIIPISGAKNATLPLMIAACSPTRR